MRVDYVISSIFHVIPLFIRKGVQRLFNFMMIQEYSYRIIAGVL